MEVDHAAAGHMGEVKDQGRCGSCWAFTANTTLEGTISKKKTVARGEFVPPIHISEQMLIDCTLEGQTDYEFPNDNNYRQGGCAGGWMEYAWWFMRDEGAILEADYPNVSQNTGRNGTCTFEPSKVMGRVGSWGTITGTDDLSITKINEVKQKTME